MHELVMFCYMNCHRALKVAASSVASFEYLIVVAVNIAASDTEYH